MKAKNIALVVLVILGIRTIVNVFSSQMIDFSAYVTTSKVFVFGQDPYTTEPLSLLYPPASLALFVPFSVLPYQYAKTIWVILSLVSLVLGLHLLYKNLTSNLKKEGSLTNEALFILFILQLFPVKFSLAQGQINSFVFLGIVLLFNAIKRQKPILVGAILAILVNIKLIPIFFALYLVLSKQTKALLYFSFFYLITNFAVDLLSPIDLNSSFISQTINRSFNPPLYYYNQSLTAFIYRIGFGNISFYVNLALIALTSVVTILKPKQQTKNLALFLCCALLISPITWQHYLFWTIPLFVSLVPPKINYSAIPLLLSFILININLKNPDIYLSHQTIYSHSSFGLILLYACLLFLPVRFSMRTPSQSLH